MALDKGRRVRDARGKLRAEAKGGVVLGKREGKAGDQRGVTEGPWHPAEEWRLCVGSGRQRGRRREEYWKASCGGIVEGGGGGEAGKGMR